jgi:enamine deaminase RidA (YjgF/YER057c/UK114 family)
MSSVILGRDPQTGETPPTVAEQCRHMFEVVGQVLAAAGGSPDNIVKMSVWLADPTDRSALNLEWLQMFPDEASRPARHTFELVDGGESLVQCEVVAVFD